METRYEDVRQRFAVQLHQFGMFKDKKRSPGGAGFRLKLHQTKPDAPLSPYYIDLRMLRSYPSTIKVTAVDLFQMMMSALTCQVLADVPTAITPIVSSLSDRTGVPMITPRGLKDHGGGGNIDGVWSEGDIALLFDDLVTEAHSKLEAAKVLRAERIEVSHVLVLLDREQGGSAQLSTADLTLHSAFTITELLQLYRDLGTITTDLYEEIRAYREAQQQQTT